MQVRFTNICVCVRWSHIMPVHKPEQLLFLLGVRRRTTEALPARQGLGENVSSPDGSDRDPLEFPSSFASASENGTCGGHIEWHSAGTVFWVWCPETEVSIWGVLQSTQRCCGYLQKLPAWSTVLRIYEALSDKPTAQEEGYSWVHPFCDTTPYQVPAAHWTTY